MIGSDSGNHRCRTASYIDREIIWKNQPMLGILRGNKRKAERIAVRSRQCTPPVCQELACRAISCIIPQYSLNLTRLSNSRLSRNGVRHCLPQTYPHLVLCCLAALTPPLVFSLTKPYPHHGSTSCQKEKNAWRVISASQTQA